MTLKLVQSAYGDTYVLDDRAGVPRIDRAHTNAHAPSCAVPGPQPPIPI